MNHHDDHDHLIEPHTKTLHTRREFLRTSFLGAAVSWTLPLFIEKTFGAMDAEAADSAIQTRNGKDSEILVVLQMAGGNDGLNMVVPFGDDAYYRSRPTIAHKADKVLKLSNYVGLSPALSGIKGLYDEGNLAVLQGVGYPNPNRSHFRSMEIWQTASEADRFESYGWLGRYFDCACKGADPTVGVAVGNDAPQAFRAKNPTGVAFARPDQYRWVNTDGEDSDQMFRDLNRPDDGTMSGASIPTLGTKSKEKGVSAMDFLQRTALDAQLSSDKILDIAKKVKSTATYPKTGLGDNLALVARMIGGGLPTRVYYVSQGGFDTHTNQIGTHDRLMTEFNEALVAFVAEMKAQGNWQRVTILTFSEFGRRVSQNASGGTDHGAAAPGFVIGGKVKGGLYGKYPSLTTLQDGDLIYNLDFRSVYATILDQVLKAPSSQILGKQFAHVPFV